jgi:hypothetical protein
MLLVVCCGVAIAVLATHVLCHADRVARKCFNQLVVLSGQGALCAPCTSFLLFVSCVDCIMLLAAVGSSSVATGAVRFGFGSCAPQLQMWERCVGVVGASGLYMASAESVSLR